MTFEERLDRLAERHEALTQTVELLAHAQLETQRRNEEYFAKSEVLMSQVIESIDSLARIAHAHERRISDLEEGRQ